MDECERLQHRLVENRGERMALVESLIPPEVPALSKQPAARSERIRHLLPMPQAVTFLELPRSGFRGARHAFRVRDVDLLLQAFELAAVGAEKVLEEADPVPCHGTPRGVRSAT